MNKLLAGIGIGLLLGFVGYRVLTVFLPNEFISKDFARVEIRNESGGNIKNIILQHKHGSVEANGVRDKEEIQFAFRNAGENSYKITVTFDDDRIVTSNEMYVEYGYRGIETVRESGITSDNNW